jgi:hypothetical protein
MIKTRLELLEQELTELTEVIRHQFIERDICMYHQEMEAMAEVVEEIKILQRRLEAIKHLLELEREKSEGKDFFEILGVITIKAPSRG